MDDKEFFRRLVLILTEQENAKINDIIGSGYLRGIDAESTAQSICSKAMHVYSETKKVEEENKIGHIVVSGQDLQETLARMRAGEFVKDAERRWMKEHGLTPSDSFDDNQKK